MEWVLIIAVIASLIAMVVLLNRQETAEEAPKTEVTLPTVAAPVPEEENKAPIQFDDALQKTIYAFHSPTSIRCCKTCDGENNVSSEFCLICGEKL